MTDCEALYQAILANPDDDTLRLIFADALEEENGQERAAFIRDQIKFAAAPEYDPATIQYRHREQTSVSSQQLLSQLPTLPDGLRWARQPYRRGLPAAIVASDAAAFVDHADELFALAPIESVELSLAPLSEVQGFARSPWRNRLTRLSILQGLGAQSANGLLGKTTYQRLKELHIGPDMTTPATVSSIVHSRAFRQLNALRCGDDRTGGQTFVNELVQLTNPPHLKTLDLSGNRLTEESLSRLLSAPAIAMTENLDLSQINLGPGSVSAIARAKLPQLRSLQLMRTYPDEDGIQALLGAQFLSGLRSLNLSGNYLRATAVRLLAWSAGLGNLRVLELRENQLGDSGAEALAAGLYFHRLARLDLSDNEISDAGAKALCDSAALSGLVQLSLEGNAISEESAERLRERFGDRVAL